MQMTPVAGPLLSSFMMFYEIEALPYRFPFDLVPWPVALLGLAAALAAMFAFRSFLAFFNTSILGLALLGLLLAFLLDFRHR